MFSGPSSFTWDFSLTKRTAIRESQALQFGARVENILNHPTFLVGDHRTGSEQCGRVTSPFAEPRGGELLLRYSF